MSPTSWQKSIIYRAFIIILLVAIILGSAFAYYYNTEVKLNKDKMFNHNAHLLSAFSHEINDTFETITSDLLFLGELHGLRHFLSANQDEDADEIRTDFLKFAQVKGLYDQVRCLDSDGMEVIRINYNSGNPTIVPDSNLQNKKGRYYFDDTIRLKRGEVFISPLDLNIERGEIEFPYKPMIRFGTPLYVNGKKRGIILLNYLAGEIIQHLRESTPGDSTARPLLLNKDGYWLMSSDAEDEWGFMFNNGKTFKKRYPDIWEEISSNSSGHVITSQGLFSFVAVRPLKEEWVSSTGSAEPYSPSAQRIYPENYRWKAVLHIPHEHFTAYGDKLSISLISAYVMIMFFITVLSWVYATAYQKRRTIEGRFQAIADNTYDLECWFSPKGVPLWISPSIERLTGYGVDECKKMKAFPFALIYKRDKRKALIKSIDAIANKTSGNNYEIRTVRKDGSLLWVAFSWQPIYINGEYMGIRTSGRDIDEKKQIENALKSYKFTLDQVVDCIFIFRDTDYKFTYVNDGATKQVGYSTEELMQMTPLDIKPDLTLESFKEMVEPLLSGHKASHSFQTVHRHKDGHDIPVDIILQHDKIHWGDDRFVAVVRDIAEIKKTENALNKALTEKTALVNRLDMLNRAIEGTQVGITICDNERNIIYVNEADAKMHGYAVGELLGLKTSTYKSKEQKDQKHLNELDLTDGWVRESVNISRDGREFAVLLSSVYIKDDEGKPNAMVTACEDITDIKKAQEAITKNEAFLNSILNSTDEPILVVNVDYEVIMMNKSARRNANSNANLSEPPYCYQVAHHGDAPCQSDEHKCSLREVFNSGKPFSDIHIHKNKKGEDVYVDVIASPIFDEEGEVFAVVESCHDITEIIKTRDNLKQALSDKEMLIKEVHHRVKNNLAVIQSLLSLQSSQSKDTSAKYALNESQSRVRAMSLIHEKLYRSTDLSTLDFSDYITSLANQIYTNYCTNKQDINMKVEIPQIAIDIDTIIPCGLIVNELLTNTFKYAFPKGRKGEAFVGVEYDEVGQMFLVARDNGVGLPEELDISASDSLGMKIVKSLSSQIGSDVQISSDANGTEFRIMLLKANLKPLEWDDTHHLIGHELIDKQHRHLYDAIENLKCAIEACRHEEGMTELVPALIKYVGEHFKTEEDIMVEQEYPAYESHKKAHMDFVEKVQEVVSEIQAGKIGLSLSVYDFLANWLMDHMWNVDMEMGAFMQEKGLATKPSAADVQKGCCQIINIEDDKLAQIIMSRFLQKNGYSYIMATTGKEALRESENNCFELIISDVMLPDMDGIEAITKLRASGVNAPVLFLTGKDSDDISGRVKGLHTLGILSKPVSFPDLKKMLSEFFEKESASSA